MNWKIGNNNEIYLILIDWLMCCSWTILWQIFNIYSGPERNSLIYKYYIEIQTVRIFTWQFSIESVNFCHRWKYYVRTVDWELEAVTCPIYIHILLTYMITYICIFKLFLLWWPLSSNLCLFIINWWCWTTNLLESVFLFLQPL